MKCLSGRKTFAKTECVRPECGQIHAYIKVKSDRQLPKCYRIWLRLETLSPDLCIETKTMEYSLGFSAMRRDNNIVVISLMSNISAPKI